MDLLVKWDQDGSENVVRETDIVIIDVKKKGGKVKMWWKPDRAWWTGKIMACTDSEDSSSEDDVPLAVIAQQPPCKTNKADVDDHSNKPNHDGNDSELEVCDDEIDDDHDMDYIPSDSNEEDETYESGICEMKGCNNKVFAACSRCLKLMCYNHFVANCIFCQSKKSTQPEGFSVDGVPREESVIEPNVSVSRKQSVKSARGSGQAYLSEKSNNQVKARNVLLPRCSSKRCAERNLACDSISQNTRQNILEAYYNIPSLDEKRRWLVTHVVASSRSRSSLPKNVKGRKSRTLQYLLPNENGEMVQVCRVMFLATINVAERQVRTALEKLSKEGVVDGEKRGGRRPFQRARDHEIRKLCKSHIDRFPRTESHYCRSSTKNQFLSGDLSIRKMYEMFKSFSGRQDISFSTYVRVFNSLKLKFHQPTKDLCGICESFRRGNPEQKDELQDRYNRHIAEKEAVRRLKQLLKEQSDPSHLIATFDLEQVIYLPKTNRCEVFYKRRLSNYNFTVYNIKSKEVFCFLWNESIAQRGANEISSCVHDFLVQKDKQGCSNVSLFSDGCSGQNKNSILPSMLLDFVQKSKFINEITMYYFETNHGQNEGDSVHSTVERALKRAGEIMVPSQLSTLIKLARRDPYTVIQMTTSDILDWKQFSQQLGTLRVRISEEGTQIDWTSIMQLKVVKSDDMKLFFKLSHLQPNFCTLNLESRRSSTTPCPVEKAYKTAPKISTEKYADLESLCCGETPVVSTDEARKYYMQLPH